MQKSVQKPTDKSGTPAPFMELSGRFFGDKHILILTTLVLLAGLVGALVAFALYEISSTPSQVTFPTTDDGRYFAPAPLNEPGITQSRILQWSVEAVTSAYSFNFIDFKKSILQVRRYFTDAGYRQYLKALTDSNMVNTIITNKDVISATPTSAPIILKEAILSDGSYSWQIKLPILALYENSSKQVRQFLIVVMTIKRVPEEESEDGIAIDSILVREGKT